MSYVDYTDAGLRVFGIYGGNGEGGCECGQKDCKSGFKHPRSKNWSRSPAWSDEQLEAMDAAGYFKTGFGVVVDGLLVVDIDPRNGGKPWPLLDDCKFIVSTGGGGWHYYYKAPKGVSLVAKHDAHPGVDFKSSGYVVGAGSLHASGTAYEIERGTPEDIGEAPQQLIDMLRRPETFRAVDGGAMVDVTEAEIETYLSYVDPDCDYDTWISCGMAIHEATSGACFDLWDKWSRLGKKYAGQSGMEKHWHSFGKSMNPVTIGTLIYHAKQGGYEESVTFETTLIDVTSNDHIDLLRPPGFVGDVCAWVNDQCRYPREHLAATCSILAVGNILGPNYVCDQGATPNMLAFCVAGSASGKDAVLNAMMDIHKAGNIAHCHYGRIKSEQEMVRNFCENQRALYVTDEVGDMLAKLVNAAKKGGTPYLEGIIPFIMEAFTKARKTLALSGDVKREQQARIEKEVAAINKMVDQQGQREDLQERLDAAVAKLESIANGIDRPFLSIAGFSTPERFRHIVNRDQVTSGFIGRSIIADEKNTTPRAKRGFVERQMSDEMRERLAWLAIDRPAPFVVETDPAAVELLYNIQDKYQIMSEAACETGLEALPRRAYEMVLKVSLVLGAAERLRTVDHVQWAAAFVDKDIETKMTMASASMAEEDKRLGDALLHKIMGLLDVEHFAGEGTIANRCRPHKREHVIEALAELERLGKIRAEKTARTTKYALLS